MWKMFTSGRNLPRRLNPIGSAFFASKTSKFEPRTESLTRHMVPWRFKRFENMPKVFRLLEPLSSATGIIKFLQTPFDFRQSKLNSWVLKKVYLREIELQSCPEEQREALGSNISVGHMLVPLGAAVKYKGKPWIKTRSLDHGIPDVYQEDWLLEAIDMSGSKIRYEGLENFSGLSSLISLSAQNCPHLDDWCLDLVACHILSLETLDISGCTQVSPKGIVALARLANLHSLNLSDIPSLQTAEGRLMCLLLQDVNKKLKIKGITFSEDLDDNDCDNLPSPERKETSVPM